MTLIMGCGNAGRGDDAAGLLAVRRLRELGIEAEEYAGDGYTLLDRWCGVDDVVLIDAVVTGCEPGTTIIWEEPACPVDERIFARSTHGVGLGEAIRLGRVLGRMPRRLRIFGIEAGCLEPGTAPTHKVLSGVGRVTELIASEMRTQGVSV